MMEEELATGIDARGGWVKRRRNNGEKDEFK
jgi:hypothetical protein